MPTNNYKVQIDVCGNFKVDILADSMQEATEKAVRLVDSMDESEIRRRLTKINDIERVYVEEESPIVETTLMGKEWRILPFVVVPREPILGITSNKDTAMDDWHVLTTEWGELWMNNCDGYTYIIGSDRTYFRYI